MSTWITDSQNIFFRSTSNYLILMVWLGGGILLKSIYLNVLLQVEIFLFSSVDILVLKSI